MSVKHFFQAKLQQARQYIRGVLLLMKTTARSLYFPDEVSLYTDSLVRFAFSLYYLPLLILVLAATHSALQRVVWVLVVPVTQEMEQHPYISSHVVTLVKGLWSINLKIAPFAALGISFATVGHKMMNCLTEAMIDAYTTHKGKDYPLTSARLSYMMAKRSRLYIFSIVMTVLIAIMTIVVHTNAFIAWTRHNSEVLLLAWTIIVVEALFVVFTAVEQAPPKVLKKSVVSMRFSQPAAAAQRREKGRSGEEEEVGGTNSSTAEQPPVNGDKNQPVGVVRRPGEAEEDVDAFLSFTVYFNGYWWKKNIHFMRHIAFLMATLYGVLFAIYRGPVNGVTTTVLMLMYLNFPHLLGYTALSVSAAVIRHLRSFAWLRRHRDALLPVITLASFYLAVLLNAIWHFRRHPATCALLGVIGVLLVARAIDLVREFDVTKRGSVQWSNANNGVLLPPYLATVLEDAYEKRFNRPSVVSLDLAVNIEEMKITYSSGAELPLSREQVVPYGTAQRFLRCKHFYAYVVPRLLSLQSPGFFGGAKYRKVRVWLRIASVTLLIVFALVTTGMILQAAFPQLRPMAVRVAAPEDNSYLTFDHIVVKMHLLSQKASQSGPHNASDEASGFPAYLSGIPEAAQSAFKWNNLTSPEDEDFYPQLCTRAYHGTSVWEMSLLAVAPYLFNMNEFDAMLKFMNSHMQSDWVVRKRHGSSCIPGDSNHQPTGWTGFYEVYSKQRNTSIITIRGTDMFSFTDFLIDINLFFETFLYQLMTTVVPGAVVLPRDLVTDLIRMASLPPKGTTTYETWKELTQSKNTSLRRCQQNNFRRDFFADVYNHIAYIGSRENHPKHILLTGHSLGGTVATIIAAQMQIKAVAFSAPGILMARKKFNVDLLPIHKYVMTIISSNDVVPSFGEHGGEVQHVECLAVTRELCHAMEFLIGSLWRSCSSVRARFPQIKDVV